MDWPPPEEKKKLTSNKGPHLETGFGFSATKAKAQGNSSDPKGTARGTGMTHWHSSDPLGQQWLQCDSSGPVRTAMTL